MNDAEEVTADVLVLGGGSAGYAFALRARQLNKSVILIEADALGGTCLNRGCVPTKALLHVSEIAHSIQDASKYGLNAQLNAIDMASVLAYKNSIVSSKLKGLTGLLKAKGVRVVEGFGKLVSANQIEVNGRVFSGTNIVLATGSHAKMIPGLNLSGNIITSDQALERAQLPSSVIILGGGVIGLEFASYYAAMGAKVTIIEAASHLAALEDEDISKQLESAYKKRGIEYLLNTLFSSAMDLGTEVRVTTNTGQELSADLLLVAVGRGPNTADIGLEGLGISVEKGFVLTNNNLQTNIPNIYAIGDIVPGLQLAHRSYAHGIFAAEHMAGLSSILQTDINTPKVTYCNPQIASIGLTTSKAQEQYGQDNIEQYTYNLAGNAKSSILGTTGIVKAIRVKNGPIVGIHAIGDRVGELVGEAQLIVSWDAHPEDVAPLIHAHPTQNEMLGEVMLRLAGKPLHGV